VVEGEVADVSALSAELKDFFRRTSLPRQVRLGVANQKISVRELELPMIEDEREQAAAVRFQAAEAVAMPLDEAVLDYQVIGESRTAEGSPRLRVVVVAAQEGMINALVEAVRGAGLKPVGIDLNAFAVVRALAPAEPDVEGPARAYVHLGGVPNLALAAGSSCVFTRALSVAEDPEAYAASLGEQIRLSIDYYRVQPDARFVEEIVISGPVSAQPGLAESLAQTAGLPVTVAEPLGGMSASSLPPGEEPQLYTVATGLALGEAAA